MILLSTGGLSRNWGPAVADLVEDQAEPRRPIESGNEEESASDQPPVSDEPQRRDHEEGEDAEDGGAHADRRRACGRVKWAAHRHSHAQRQEHRDQEKYQEDDDQGFHALTILLRPSGHSPGRVLGPTGQERAGRLV